MTKRLRVPAVAKCITRAGERHEIPFTFTQLYADNLDAFLAETKKDHISYEIWVGDTLVAGQYNHYLLAEYHGDA